MVLCFVFGVKYNEFVAFSVQYALEAPMAAPAPRELPKASQMPPRWSVAILAQGVTDQGDIQGGISEALSCLGSRGPGLGFLCASTVFCRIA